MNPSTWSINFIMNIRLKMNDFEHPTQKSRITQFDLRMKNAKKALVYLPVIVMLIIVISR